MRKIIDILPVVLRPDSLTGLEKRAVDVFIEETLLHTGLQLSCSRCVMSGVSSISILSEQEFIRLYPDKLKLLERYEAPGAEGFRLFFELGEGKFLHLYAIGHDARGVFYAMGKLLRLLSLKQGHIGADMLFQGLSSTPKYTMRGHQLGYRDKQNTLPCWTEKEFDRYIRDLALFGTNSIEWLPPRTDDHLFSRKMQVDPFEMMVHAANIVESYGLDFWLWYPNMGHDYHDPACMDAELKERETVFSALPNVAGMLVPAGDPGELEPEMLFPVVERCAALLHQYHPQARVMLAPQCFAPQPGWYDAFYKEVAKEPAWLWGVCFAPWEKDSIEEMASKLPPVYRGRIRHYPDITHEMGCQFALPHRDPAFGIIQGRECCDPRPRAMKIIHNYFAPWCVGSITYSEGVHDDVNKFVWGQQDWDSHQSAESTVREYVRYFIDPALEDNLTRCIMLLEENWYSALNITKIPTVEQAWQLMLDIDAQASAAVKDNWRYQLLLLRVLADHYIQEKQQYDSWLEVKAREVLRTAAEIGAVAAIREALDILDRGVDEPCDPCLRNRLLKLSDTLHISCGIKLTTHHHDGQRWGRGAWLDLVDMPLNDAPYFQVTLKHALRLETEAARLEAIDQMLRRTEVGPGEVYVDMGSVESRKLLKDTGAWESDPSLLHTPFTTVNSQSVDQIHSWMGTWRERAVPRALLTCMQTYYDTPLRITLDGLADGVDYELTVAYIPGRHDGTEIRLTADNVMIHEQIAPRPDRNPWYTYEIPARCIRQGTLTLNWQPYGKVSGVRIHELFLRKKA